MGPMIARTTATPAAAYRVGNEQKAVKPVSRRTWNRAWLAVALTVVGLAVAREARSFGAVGLLAPILIVVVVIIVGAIAPAWLRPWRPAAPPPAPRDVTPREPAVGSSSTIAPRPTPAPVVVIEPARGGETLEAKLATLDRLRADGRLTDAEYEAKRAQLIADF
jgi:hypothetical protein